jgi:hypothetical protein
MPMPSEMGIAIPQPIKDAIITDLTNALNALNGIKVVQLTANERQGAQSIAEKRFPYVQKGVKALAPSYPNLQPNFLSLANAENDLDTTQDMTEILLLVKEITDRFTDFGLASEHFAYQYVRKFYAIAKEAQSVNTPGADTVVSELAPLFEGQGNANEQPEPIIT